MAYPTYFNNNYYIQDLQNMKDRIESQIRQIQQNQVQPQAQQPITQNFQLAPNTNLNELESKYAENIEEVRNTFVMKTGVFINRDFSTLWIKSADGKIRTFDTQEVIEIDEKDKEIIELKKQINEMRGMIENATSSSDKYVDEQTTEQKPTRVQSSKRTNAK